MGRTVLAVVLMAAIGAILIWDWDEALFQIYRSEGFADGTRARAFARSALSEATPAVWPAIASLAFRFGDDGLHALRWVATLALGAYAAMWLIFARIAFRSIGSLQLPDVERTQLGIEQVLFGAITILAVSPGVARAFWDGTDAALWGAVVAGTVALATPGPWSDSASASGGDAPMPLGRSFALGILFALAVGIRPEALLMPLALAVQRVLEHWGRHTPVNKDQVRLHKTLIIEVTPALLIAGGIAFWGEAKVLLPTFDIPRCIVIGLAAAFVVYAPRIAPSQNAFLPRTRRWLVASRWYGLVYAFFPYAEVLGITSPMLQIVLWPTTLLLLIDITLHLVRAQPVRPLRSVLRPLRTTALLVLLAWAGMTAPDALHVTKGHEWKALGAVASWLRDHTKTSSVVLADDAPVLTYIAQRNVRGWPSVVTEAPPKVETQSSVPRKGQPNAYALVVFYEGSFDKDAMTATATQRARAAAPLRLVAFRAKPSAALFELPLASP